MIRKLSTPGKGPDNKQRSQFEQCQICSIRHTSVCGSLSDAEHSGLNKIAHHRNFSAGQIIMSDQRSALFLASLRLGVVKLIRKSSDRAREIVRLLFPPDFLGHAFPKMRSYSVEAVTDVDICCFPRTAFAGVVKEYPNLEHRLFYHTSATGCLCSAARLRKKRLLVFYCFSHGVRQYSTVHMLRLGLICRFPKKS